MAAATTGSKTVTKSAAGHTAAQLTTILATPVESLTVAQLDAIGEAIRASAHGGDPATLVGALLP